MQRVRGEQSLLWEVGGVSWEFSEAPGGVGFPLGLRDGHSQRVQKTEHSQQMGQVSGIRWFCSQSLMYLPSGILGKGPECIWRLCRRLRPWWERLAHSPDHSNTSVNVGVNKDDHKDGLVLCTAVISDVTPCRVSPELGLLHFLWLTSSFCFSLLYTMTFHLSAHIARCGRLSRADLCKPGDVHTVMKSPNNTSLRTDPCR